MEGETKKGNSEQNYLFCLRLFTIVKFVESQNHPTIFDNLRRILSLRLLPMQARIWPLKSSQRAVRLLGWNTEEIWTKPYHIGGKLWRGNTTNLSTRKLKKNTCGEVKTTKLVDSVVRQNRIGNWECYAKKGHTDQWQRKLFMCHEQLTFWQQNYGPNLKYQDDIFGRHENTKVHIKPRYRMQNEN